MLYFKWLGFTLGIVFSVTGLLVFIKPQFVFSFLSNQLCPEKKAERLGVVTFVVLAAVVFAWKNCAAVHTAATLFIALIATLSLFKLILMLVFYTKWRVILITLFGEEKAALYTLSGCTLAIGVIVLAMSLLM